MYKKNKMKYLIFLETPRNTCEKIGIISIDDGIVCVLVSSTKAMFVFILPIVKHSRGR